MDIDQLGQFISICETGTLTAAAKQAGISQSTLTRFMQRLEKELETPLFDRKSRRLELNDAGRIVLRFAQSVTLSRDLLMSELDALKGAAKALRIGTVAPAPLWNLVVRLTELDPEIAIDSSILSERDVVDSLKGGGIDAAITEERLSEEEILSVSFMTERLFVLAPESSDISSSNSVTWRELNGRQFLLLSDAGCWADTASGMLPDSRFVMQSDKEVFRHMVAVSDVLAFTSDAPQNWQKVPGRKPVPIRDETAKKTFWLSIKDDSEEILHEVTARL